MPVVLEFWPEEKSGPLFTADGTTADLSALPISEDLRSALNAWNNEYDDSKLPFEQNDTTWLERGVTLLSEIRSALGENYDVVVTEPWWGEEPSL